MKKNQISLLKYIEETNDEKKNLWGLRRKILRDQWKIRR